MASRQMKMPVTAKDDSDKEVDDVFSQRKRPERGRYLLQVDRQTKGSYTTSEAAQIGGAGDQDRLPDRSGLGIRQRR